MAMRIFSAADFHTELERMGLKPTGITTATTTIWLTPNEKAMSVPNLGPKGGYPEYVLDEILRQVNLLYRPWDRPIPGPPPAAGQTRAGDKKK